LSSTDWVAQARRFLCAETHPWSAGGARHATEHSGRVRRFHISVIAPSAPHQKHPRCNGAHRAAHQGVSGQRGRRRSEAQQYKEGRHRPHEPDRPNEDPLPDGIYDDAQAAIIRYAQKSTRLEPIDDITYRALGKYFSAPQIMDICLTVGLSNMVNRFHATFLTDVDEVTIAEVEAGDAVAGMCAIPGPKL
jgi:hypothetical protein